jgi:hypothetical protein
MAVESHAFPDVALGQPHDRLAALRASLTLIEDAVEAGQFRPVNAAVVADAMTAVVLRFTAPEFVRSTRVDGTTALAELVDVLLDGLRPR